MTALENFDLQLLTDAVFANARASAWIHETADPKRPISLLFSFSFFSSSFSLRITISNAQTRRIQRGLPNFDIARIRCNININAI
jgi:hypothetical protein